MLSVFVLAVGACACLATLTGGLFALWFRDRLHLVLGFSAGAIIAVAFFEIMPEALELGGTVWTPSLLLGLSGIAFFIYAVLDRLILLHTHDEHGHEGHAGRGWIGAGSLSVHSMLDGFAMGVAFQASPAIGAAVAVAILTHDFSDGINTVNLVVKNGGSRGQAFRWLISDAVAPIAGAALSLFVRMPPTTLSLFLAAFGGFFLYIGASDLLPESQHAHPKFLTTVMTLLGAAVLFAVTRLAG
jgi:zinc transporter ZupT